jgi:hypothetical protein
VFTRQRASFCNIRGEHVALIRHSALSRPAAVALAGLIFVAGGIVLPVCADAPADSGLVSARSYVPTDGMLNDRAVRRLRRTTAVRRARKVEATETASSPWLFDYVARILGDEPAAARRPRRAAKPVVAVAATATAAVVAPVASKPAVSVAAAMPILVQPATNPIATGAINPGPAAQVEAPEALVVAAERSQARLDLVKLELAARTYDERKLSGQMVFETRSDWRVLERARDALSSAELTSAAAAGFEANAYINEASRTIVVAVAGSQDLRRDFIAADVWKALIRAEAPQQFYLAKTYVRSVIQRYQMQGFSTECVGHSLGGGACAYAAAELGIRAVVINPVSAGKLPAPARFLVTNYVVDGEIASLLYGARGNESPGTVQVVNDGRDVIRLMALEKYGQMAGPILVIRELRASIQTHKIDHALDLIAAQAETSRPR